ncbi:hypothetical protein ABMA27_010219 [Loxostege sticticalis]|uniref:Uncharacterized protein n=1 Tax=Loxostege sticticalis TaxID=481309 RepID=A0ABR3H502_LOXSC
MLVVTGDIQLGLQSIPTQFPNHVDLQKVGEVKFNHEKYNILRPTLHTIQDYFHDTMMRRDSSDFPTQRVFIDENGFRHYWSGFEESEKNLRKSDTPINQANETISVSDVSIKNNGSEKSDTPINQANETISVSDVSIKNNGSEGHNSTRTRKLPKRRKKVEAVPTRNILRASIKSPAGGGTIAKTTFFCPFFGVVTMTTLLH